MAGSAAQQRRSPSDLRRIHTGPHLLNGTTHDGPASAPVDASTSPLSRYSLAGAKHRVSDSHSSSQQHPSSATRPRSASSSSSSAVAGTPSSAALERVEEGLSSPSSASHAGATSSDYAYGQQQLKARTPTHAATPSTSPTPSSSSSRRAFNSQYSPKGSKSAFGLPAPAGRRWRFGLPRSLLGRSKSMAAGALLILALWLLLGKNTESAAISRTPITTRWWDPETTDNLPALLPRPSMLPKPPKPKPPLLTSHTLKHLNQLRSSLGATADWTALVHFTSQSQLSHLTALIPSLQKQSIAPQRTLLLLPEGLSPDLKRFGSSITTLSYPSDRPESLAVILASSSIPTTYLLLLSASVSPLHPEYAKTLLRASGTKEYGSALLSSGGLTLPLSHSSSPKITCHVHPDRTTALHAPTTPFLLQTTWLPSLSQGLRTDLPLEMGLALALWTKASIPSFALPVPLLDPTTTTTRDASQLCESISKHVKGRERQLGPLFRSEAGGGTAPLLTTETDEGGSVDPSRRLEKDGAIVLLLSGDDELARAHALACAFAERHRGAVRVFVLDDDTEDGGRKGGEAGPRVFFDDEERCHLDVHPLALSRGKEVKGAVQDELDRLEGKVDLVVYVVDGERGREFGEVLRAREGVFGVRSEGRRRSKSLAEEKGGTVVLPLLKADIVHADWIATLPMEALRHWHTPKIDITIITNNRPASLYRLLRSLQEAHYFGDEISLSINLEQTADRVTHEIVDELPWSHGSVTVRHRIVLGGLFPSIVESWYPTSNDSYGVFLEDDIEVSPFFYSWLKMTLLHYRYFTPLRERSTRLFGISLYNQHNNELRLEGRKPFNAQALLDSLGLPPGLPYLSQVPCSWGAAYFPEIWREFHAYTSLRLSEVSLPISDPIVPEVKSNKWPRSWKRYFIELVYMRGYVMLYPNYDNFTSFSNNHMEKGAHIHVSAVDQKRKEQFTSPLMQRHDSVLDLPDGKLPPSWDALQITDLWGSLASDEDLVERGWQSVAQLDTCPPFRLDILPTYNARELLCPKTYTRTNVLVEAQPLALSDTVAGLGQGKAQAPPALRQRDLDSQDDDGAVVRRVGRPPLVDHPESGTSPRDARPPPHHAVIPPYEDDDGEDGDDDAGDEEEVPLRGNVEARRALVEEGLRVGSPEGGRAPNQRERWEKRQRQ